MSSSNNQCPSCHALISADDLTQAGTSWCPACGLVLPKPVDGQRWFVARRKEKLGPLSLAELHQMAAAGDLSPSDMLLEAGSNRWIEARSRQDLFFQETRVEAPKNQVTVPSEPPVEQTIEFPPQGPKDPAMVETLPCTPGDPLPGELAPKSEAITARVPGYELLGVLGQGGMGVVYKARQEGLKRTVALKMILGGAHVDPQQLVRFRMEAEAVARLQHPNIVQIYEIGEQEGLPYFSLEYANGGTLADRIGGKPQPPREAAGLVQTLARAMHAAHQEDIVHRDLKPANILLMADGTPKITDFGLAKQLDTNSGQTRSGAVMGTPSYMAPEQAAGRIKEIGPACDVYALGAILYELLTGQPPFRGESVMDTMLMAVSDEPVPPRRHQSRVPVDLETICLKCLTKESAHRYPSALALAHELERFQAGESILARPEGLGTKLWRKVRRRPMTYASFLAVILIATVLVGAFARYARSTSEYASLNESFHQGLESDHWSRPAQLQPHLQELESIIERIADSQPHEAPRLRQRLHEHLAKSIEEYIQSKPVFQTTDVTHVRAALGFLEKRSPDLSRKIQEQFNNRLKKKQRVIALQYPFQKVSGLDATFSRKYRPKVVDQAMSSPAREKSPRVLTQIPCQGEVEFKAEFDTGWQQVSQLGLVLNAEPKSKKGYTFLIRTARLDSEVASPSSPTFASVRKNKGQVLVQILRNDIRLAERRIKAITLPPGKLRLQAKRNEDRLVFQVNDNPPLEIRDQFPLVSGDSVFGLVWPARSRMSTLEAWCPVLPSGASPLERGNDLYAKGQWDEALAAFRELANTTDKEELRQQLRYKEALCLIQLKQYEPAVLKLEELIQAGSSRLGDSNWSALAGCQLWQVRLRQHRFDEADAIFKGLSTRYRFEQLALLIPEDLLKSILDGYLAQAKVSILLRANPRRIRNLEQAAALEKIFQVRGSEAARFMLFRTYHGEGNIPRALEVGRELIEENPPERTYKWLSLLEEYCWLLRLDGRAREALTLLDRYLYEKPGVYRPGRQLLLVERARIHAALAEWQQAEKDIDSYLALDTGMRSYYRNYYNACLIGGFLRERRGDQAGARELWGKGGALLNLYNIRANHVTSSFALTGAATLVALKGGFTGLEMRVVQLGLGQLRRMDPAALRRRLPNMIQQEISAPAAIAILNTMLKDLSAQQLSDLAKKIGAKPEGRELAKQIAFQDVSWPTLARKSYGYALKEGVREFFLAGSNSPDHDAILEALARTTYEATTAGRIRRDEISQLLMTYQGNTGIFGWKGVVQKLKPYADLRGPLAYLMGKRYLKLNRAREAAMFFGVALADAPPDSPLRRLAKHELDRKNAE